MRQFIICKGTLDTLRPALISQPPGPLHGTFKIDIYLEARTNNRKLNAYNL